MDKVISSDYFDVLVCRAAARTKLDHKSGAGVWARLGSLGELVISELAMR